MEPELKKANAASAAGVTFVGIEMVAQVQTLDAHIQPLLQRPSTRSLLVDKWHTTIFR
jgi:hypothetical protein